MEHTRTIIECPDSFSHSRFDNNHIFPSPKIQKNEKFDNSNQKTETHPKTEANLKTNLKTEHNPPSHPTWPTAIKKLTKSRPSLGGATGASGAKLVLVGDQAVGKTTLVRKFSRGTFNNDYKATIGIDFEVVRFRILNIPFSVQLWDTAGQERFRAMSSQYYRKAKVVFMVADGSDEGSIDNLRMWNGHVEESVQGVESVFKGVGG